ncbi:MAG: ATP-binding cassette domain-containing protein [Solirubrobacteraceae bacterium]
MGSRAVVLRLDHVVKTFPGVTALNGVTFEVLTGEVHALVGENGAGKSTLMGIAAGSTLPDSGSVEIGGRSLTPAAPAVARALGLAVVYQRLSILEDLTVAENLIYAMPRKLRPPVTGSRRWATEQLERIGAGEIHPATRVKDLGVAQRQLLEIAKALALQPRVLLLDEPTESLTAEETDRLFEQIRTMKDRGTAVVYISHRLPEVKRIADRITVLRDGEARGTAACADISEDEILQLMIGRPVTQVFPPKREPAVDGSPLLAIRDLSGPRFRHVNLEVAAGEIVGLAGVEGNGQRAFLRALGGLLPTHGSIEIEGAAVTGGNPSRMAQGGIVHLPGDRHTEGLVPLSVRENATLLSLDTVSDHGFLRRSSEGRVVTELIEGLRVRTPSGETPVLSLSGGNQQKVLIGRALLAEPKVLLADEPTRGVDAGARIEIYRLLRDVAAAGSAVMVLSTDVVELMGLCDRVVVFSRGEIVRSLEQDELTEENITGAAVTSDIRRVGLSTRVRRAFGLQRFAAGDYLSSLVLAVLIVALGGYTGASHGRFLDSFSLSNSLLLASALGLVSLGELVVLLTGGIDLSVGPLMGLVVVTFSFFAGGGQGGGHLVLGIVVVVALAVAVGLVNAILVRWIRLSAVIATIATYIILQGCSLLLRPQPGGFMRQSVVNALTTTWGWLPVAFVVTCLLAVIGELALRLSRPGLELRAVGSDEERARQLGAHVTLTHFSAYVLCAVLSAAAGLMLASQVGIGDPTVGVTYTLTGITAVVLGGASIFGGRGSFIGALLGAVLLQEIIAATTTLNLGVQWQDYLPGLLILAGAGAYSRARRKRGGPAVQEAV